MSDDTPTERFEQPVVPDVGGNKKKSRTMTIVLSAIGGLLLIAVVVLLTLVFARGLGGPSTATPDVSTSPSVSTSESPSSSPSPSVSENPTPSGSPSEEATPPPPSGPTFATFTAPSSAGCTVANPSSTITFSWSSANAVKAWFGVHTNNAKAEPYEEVETTDTYDFQYQCSNESEFYTVTLQDADGKLKHKTVTITKD